jgi:hypothetical protein
MERRCGAEAPFVTHVNLRPAAEDLPRGFFSGSATEGEVFVIEQDAAGAGVTLSWTAPDTLRIECTRCVAAPEKHDQRWNGVAINYVLPSR